MKRSLLVVSLAALVACRSDDVDCSGIGAVETDSGVCDCPAGTTWIPIKAVCEATSSSAVTDAGTKDGGLQLADAGIDAGDAAASDAARVDAAQVATGSDGAVVDAAADLADAATAADAGAASDASTTAADTGSAVVDAGPPPPPACVPVAEDCDGKDDDCDGVIDNGAKNKCGACGMLEHEPGETCSNGGQGLCAKGGTYVCMGETTICNAPPPSPGTEVCDSIDNDCDGTVDEGFAKNACGGCIPLANNKDAPCSAGVTECASAGVYACTTTEATACNAVAKAPVAEVCGDSKDNDCDGTVDDGCPPPCQPTGFETCNGKDDNCDGQIDNLYWYQDCDNDGYVNPERTMVAGCTQPTAGTCAWRPPPAINDCDDTDPAKTKTISLVDKRCSAAGGIGPGDF